MAGLIRILQLNANHSRDAVDLALQAASDRKLDVLCFAEHNVAAAGRRGQWYEDARRDAALVFLSGSLLAPDEVGPPRDGLFGCESTTVGYTRVIYPRITR